MTNEEKELIVYCLKANSDFHVEVCEECKNYPKCDHFQADSLMEKLIEVLEQEPFINKPCVSSGVCEHDKNKVLDKIRAEIKAMSGDIETIADVLAIIDKYMEERSGAE